MTPRFLPAAALALAAPLVFGSGASAHPHVFVDAHAELVFDASGAMTAVRHIWQFDRDFSQMATLNLDTNNDGKLTQNELDPLAQINMDSLKEYDYFTYFLTGGRKIDFAPPTEYFLTFHDQRLTLYYTLPLKKPLPVYSGKLEVYDPEYFVAFTFNAKDAAKLDGAPAGCTAHYQPPHELDAKTMNVLSLIPVEQHDLPADLLQAAALLANVVEVKCPPRPGEPAAPKTAAEALDAANGLATPPATAAEPAPSFQQDFQNDAAAEPNPATPSGGILQAIGRWFSGHGATP